MLSELKCCVYHLELTAGTVNHTSMACHPEIFITRTVTEQAYQYRRLALRLLARPHEDSYHSKNAQEQT